MLALVQDARGSLPDSVRLTPRIRETEHTDPARHHNSLTGDEHRRCPTSRKGKRRSSRNDRADRGRTWPPEGGSSIERNSTPQNDRYSDPQRRDRDRTACAGEGSPQRI